MLLIAVALAAPQVGSGAQLPRFTLPSDFGEAGSGSLELQLGYYDRSDQPGQGNPFLDEDVTVIEPIVVFDYNVSDTFGYSGLLVYDNVSAASIDRLARFPQQSGASGDFYIAPTWACAGRPATRPRSVPVSGSAPSTTTSRSTSAVTTAGSARTRTRR